jgi:hypothetical protein
VPNEMWLQRRGATQNEKLNSPPDHHRSLPTLVLGYFDLQDKEDAFFS